jgi:hypothetical protein
MLNISKDPTAEPYEFVYMHNWLHQRLSSLLAKAAIYPAFLPQRGL